MNHVILPLVWLGVLIAVPTGIAQNPRYSGEDSAHRQMRELRERSAAQEQAAQLATQAEQLGQQAIQLEQLRKQQQAPAQTPSLDDILRRAAAEEAFKARVAESWARVYARYPALKQEGNPWRKKLAAYVPRQSANPAKVKLFAMSDWPERIVLEFGQANGLIDPKGNSAKR